MCAAMDSALKRFHDRVLELRELDQEIHNVLKSLNVLRKETYSLVSEEKTDQILLPSVPDSAGFRWPSRGVVLDKNDLRESISMNLLRRERMLHSLLTLSSLWASMQSSLGRRLQVVLDAEEMRTRTRFEGEACRELLSCSAREFARKTCLLALFVECESRNVGCCLEHRSNDIDSDLDSIVGRWTSNPVQDARGPANYIVTG